MTVVLNGVTLAEGVDYNVYYYDNVEVGTATVEVEGEGDYTGLATVTFRIVEGDLDGVTMVELYGSNRYDTMVEIAQEAFADTGSTYAVLATGTNFPDALAAASLAGVLDAPIILVSDAKADVAIDAMLDLGVEQAYIVGGTSAVGLSVQRQVQAAGIEIAGRLAGSNRQGTALAIAQEVQELCGDETSDTCIVAAGGNFPDALSGSPYAYWSGSPIYLAKTDGSLSADVPAAIEAAGYERIIVLGGTSAVSAEAWQELYAIGDVDVRRVAGDTRYETSAAFAEWAVDEGMSYDGLAIATGTNFPDALAGSALCGRAGSVLLLAASTLAKSGDMLEAVDDNAGLIDTIYVIGGTSAVPQDIRDAVLALFE